VVERRLVKFDRILENITRYPCFQVYRDCFFVEMERFADTFREPVLSAFQILAKQN
jgi:hypothetical protein